MKRGAKQLKAASTRCFGAQASGGTVPSIDVHTHMYFPRYMKMLRERNEVPKILVRNGEDRLVVLPGEDEEASTAIGRPIGTEYNDVQRKLAFMDTHNIGASVVSLANPWLDFLPADEARDMAFHLADDQEEMSQTSGGRIYGLGTLPIQKVQNCLDTIAHLRQRPSIKGIILGTHGIGRGLDDPEMDPIWRALEEAGMFVFVHPHYGVGNEHFGSFGHSLFLALGFTFETTTAIARFIVSGGLDKYPSLKLLLAHSGGTLPWLAGRLDSCVEGEPALAATLKKKPSEYLRDMYYDAVIYNNPQLEMLTKMVGPDRIMFGTDCPFFPPFGSLEGIDEKVWPSCDKNYQAIDCMSETEQVAMLRGNAVRLMGLEEAK